MLWIGNGRLITRDNGAFYENGAVVIDGERIVEVGDSAALRRKYPDAEAIDARGGVIMPGLINMHNHIYSAFARGLSINGYSPKDFNDILEGQWWKIDRHLTHENNRLSAYAVYADCIKNGVTTVFDHHASFFDIPGSLDDIAEAAVRLGVRASLCYEVSDRDGEQKARESVLENERFILRTQAEGSDMLQGMMGLHASFTVSDATLALCNDLRHGAGFHVHCSEGPADLAHSLKSYGKRIIHRFYDAGVLGERTLAVHCVHTNRAEWELLRDTGFPGMRVLQFGFNPDNTDNDHLPHNYPKNCCAYTGTHDNSTIMQWYREADPKSRAMARRYVKPRLFERFSAACVRVVYASPANLAIIPMQDILGLGADARMNVPSTVGGNWKWRMLPGRLTASRAEKLRSLADTYFR